MDDLISRQNAIDKIKEFQHGAAEWRDEQEERSDIWHRADSAIASAIEIGLRIKKIPSAQKKGHWIDEGTNYLCSECHRGCWVNSDYCPWCGADMRGDESE